MEALFLVIIPNNSCCGSEVESSAANFGGKQLDLDSNVMYAYYYHYHCYCC